MILGFYKLNEQPFGVTPDPRYLYSGASHREGLASLQYGVAAGRGFTALIAEPGMGKTRLLFDFLSMVRHSAKTAFLFQAHSAPPGSASELAGGLRDSGRRRSSRRSYGKSASGNDQDFGCGF
jgi:hypothetical protein